MINKDLFYCITGQSPDIYMKPAPRLIAHPNATSNIQIVKGYAKEFYSIDDESQLYTWFWGEGEYIIPTSGYSNLILSDDAEIKEMSYRNAIKLLRSNENAKELYKSSQRTTFRTDRRKDHRNISLPSHRAVHQSYQQKAMGTGKDSAK